MRFDHRLALRIAPLLLAALVALTPPAHAQDSRRAADPVIIREHVALPPSAPDAALFGAPRTEDLVAPDGSRIRMVVTPAVGASRTRRATNAAQPLLHAPKASERRLGHPPALGPLPTYEKRRPEPGGARLDGEHAPFSTDPYGAGGTCSPLAPSVFPSDGGLFFYQTQFAGTPAYSGALSLAVYYNGAYLGLVPISDDPPSAPPVFWDEAVSAGGLLQVRSVYEYGGQSFAGDYFTVSNVAQFESYETDGIWYGGLITQIYHPTPGGGYEFIFGVGYELRLAPALASFRVAADPDTLGLGAEAIVGIEPIDADSAVLRLPSTTELTLGLDGAAGDGFGVLRLASGTDPDEVEQEGEELEAVTLEAACAERVTFTAEEYAPDGPPVVAATSGGGTARSGDLDPDIAVITANLAPSSWGPGGDGEGEVLLRLYPLQLLQQNDDVVQPGVDGDYLMVSKVRPDWLLPDGGSERFYTRFGTTPFSNDTPFAPPMADVYDPHTYRVQVFGVPDSLTTTGALDRLRFKYEVLRGGAVVWTSTELPLGTRQGAVAGQETSASSRGTGDIVNQVLRSQGYIRLVSNGPDGPGKLSSFTYDDEYRGEQTILVKLLDELRVTAYVLSEDGLSQDVLGEGTFPVGQPPSQVGIDAVRFGKLVWHTYKTPQVTVASEPAVITERVSEDWAQASIIFTQENSYFNPATTTNVLRLSAPGTNGVLPDNGTVTVELSTPDGSCSTTVIYSAGWTVNRVANRLRAQIGDVPSVGCPSPLPVGDIGVFRHSTTSQAGIGGNSNLQDVDVVFGRASETIVTSSRKTGLLGVVRIGPDFDFTPSKSEDLLTAGMAYRDADPTTVDIFAVPFRIINSYTDNTTTQAFTTKSEDQVPTVIFVPPFAVDLADDYPMVMGHEVGHALFDGPGGGLVSGPTGNHSPVEYHLLFRRAEGGGGTEKADEMKRLSPVQHVAVRCESGPVADVASLTCDPDDQSDPAAPVLLTPSPR